MKVGENHLLAYMTLTLIVGDSAQLRFSFMNLSCLAIISETGFAHLTFCFVHFLSLKMSNGMERADYIETSFSGKDFELWIDTSKIDDTSKAGVL